MELVILSLIILGFVCYILMPGKPTKSGQRLHQILADNADRARHKKNINRCLETKADPIEYWNFWSKETYQYSSHKYKF